MERSIESGLSKTEELNAKTSEQPVSRAWGFEDTKWMISLVGTAIGAGVLFLPIRAGMGGFWPLVIMVLLVGPMTYLAHRNLSRFVLASKAGNDSDITNVVVEFFGSFGGKVITFLYFFAVYPILLLYGVALTNTVNSFLVDIVHVAPMNRPLLALILIAILMAVIMTGRKLMLFICQALVYPLIGILFLLSLYMIPHWTAASLQVVPSAGGFLKTLWLTIPVLVFAFNHSPAISSFAVAQRKRMGKDAAVERSDKILRGSSSLLLFFVMFFVFSCVLALTPAQLHHAQAANITVLTELGESMGSPLMAYVAPIVAIISIGAAFFGTFLGAHEGLNGVITQQAEAMGKTLNMKAVGLFSTLFIAVTVWLVAVINPSILNLIGEIGGPVIAVILFIMPVYAIRTVPALQKYRGKLSNLFIGVMGLVAISGVLYSFFS
ncbi:SLC5/6 family protein [Dongshaea marina]|uniref:aromatic amino acid transport family protein n=1 Tax=Dongshaea marina TaxID=2047966 RepID=UPI000D3E6757|nr:aromatic amino acid transport family protein [Dongshaea marina]